MISALFPKPFGLSLSKARISSFGAGREGEGFDKLSPNGVRVGRDSS